MKNMEAKKRESRLVLFKTNLFLQKVKNMIFEKYMASRNTNYGLLEEQIIL